MWRSMSEILLIYMLLHCSSACYFPIELQGEYVMQATTMTPGNQVQYSQVNITADAIPIWGHCHRRLGNRFILTDSSGGANCIRCFHILLRSRNVLQVRTEGLDKCYTNQDAAEATCPDEKAIQQGDISKAIVFYKTKDLGGEEIKQVYCPINGRFNFVYSITDGSDNRMECPDPVSELDNCPSGSDLNLRFRNCRFQNRDVTFQCLGHWAGPGDQHYLALRDTSPMSGHQLPPYRCALYREEAGTGNVYMAFASDSTCSSNLHSATSGFETFSLSVVPSVSWPSRVDNSNCRFPSWSHGYWQHMYIEGNTLTYKDHSTFKTYTIRCLGPETATSDRFAVFARTQCGEELYNCIWLKRRGVNVLEFQLGKHTTLTFKIPMTTNFTSPKCNEVFGLQSSPYYNYTLCSDSNFEPKVWITQGRLERLQESPCPVAGEYAGVIPDAANLCAKLSSDCRSPEIMYYTVSDCSGSEVYEGTRRRGRKRRQTGTRIYRISNPRSSTTYSPSSSSIPDNTTYPNGSYGGNHQLQDSLSLHYSSLGPRYPTTYHIGSSSTTFKPVGTEDPYSEEEYDPWTFSKTHGLQSGNRTESNSYYGKNRTPDWTTESSHRTNSGWAGQYDAANWNSRYGPSGRGTKPNREWGSQSSYPGPGSDWQTNQRTGPNKDRNEYWEVTQRTPEYYPSGSRDQGYLNDYPQGTQGYPTSTNQYPQGTARTPGKYPGTGSQGYPQNDHNQRTAETFPGSNRNQGLPQSGYPQSAQNLPDNYPGGIRGQDFPQSTQRTVQNYSGTNGNQGVPHNEIPHSTQRTYENHSGSNSRNHEFPTVTQRTPDHFGAGNRNDNDYSRANERSPDVFQAMRRNQGLPSTKRNQGFRQNEFPLSPQTQWNSPGKNRNQGYPPSDYNKNQHPTQTSYENHPANNRHEGFQREYPQSTQRTFENYPNGNRNSGYPQRVNTEQAQRTYDIYRKQSYSGAGDYGRGDMSPKPGPDSTVSTPAIGIRDRNQGNSDPNGRFDSRHPWGSSVPHPVQLPPMPVERHRQGDRPSAVPRTAAPSKREEREYRCLGQWKEGGLMYTYTQRRDVGTYECFVGSIVSDNEIYIKEAGDHCQRDIDPMHNGMKLKRKGLCFGNQPGAGGNPGTGGMPQPRPTTSWMSSRRPPEPTKPWKPITAPPKDSGGADSCNRPSLLLFLVSSIIVYFLQQ